MQLVLPLALAAILGVTFSLFASRRAAFALLAVAIVAAVAGFALALAAPEQVWAPGLCFAGLGAASGVAGPLTFGRTPVGVAASVAAALFSYWSGAWALFAASCAVAGAAECV